MKINDNTLLKLEKAIFNKFKEKYPSSINQLKINFAERIGDFEFENEKIKFCFIFTDFSHSIEKTAEIIIEQIIKYERNALIKHNDMKAENMMQQYRTKRKTSTHGLLALSHCLGIKL